VRWSWFIFEALPKWPSVKMVFWWFSRCHKLHRQMEKLVKTVPASLQHVTILVYSTLHVFGAQLCSVCHVRLLARLVPSYSRALSTTVVSRRSLISLHCAVCQSRIATRSTSCSWMFWPAITCSTGVFRQPVLDVLPISGRILAQIVCHFEYGYFRTCLPLIFAHKQRTVCWSANINGLCLICGGVCFE
jgi:hypothetical protein